MSAFPIDAALEGFRFTRAHPRAILPWAILWFFAGLVGLSILIATGAQEPLSRLVNMRIDAADPTTVQPYFATLAQALPGLALKSVFDLVVSAVLATSAFRTLFREPDRVRLALGPDEARMITLWLLLLAFNFVAQFVTASVTGLVSLAAGGPGSQGGAVIMLLGQVAGLSLQAVIMVRLALALPMCVAEHRLGLAASWRRTRGRFWSMLGAFVIATLLFWFVAFLITRLLMPVGALIGARQAAQGWAQLLDPRMLFAQAGVALALALGVPILAGPLAAAYRTFQEPVGRPISAA